jgi:hypothetical protein
MSRTLDLPMDAALWDTAAAPTVVATQRGARPQTQRLLASKGVEVVEFDHLCPGALADWCAARGHLHVLWECGGTLAAPALAERVIHKVMAFVAPKIIGGGGGGGGSGGGTYYGQADVYAAPAAGEHDAAAAAGAVEDTTPYCICRRPTFGEMIGCDSPSCEIEWFHLDCVHLKAAPSGSWFCPPCTTRMVRRARADDCAARGMHALACTACANATSFPALAHCRPRRLPRRPRAKAVAPAA